jgi:uncharacterized protein YehS (DUF1456 family)
MTNNDVFRRIRYIFDFGDAEVISIFSLVRVEHPVFFHAYD